MGFWEMAYKFNWITKEILRQAVITDSNPYGEVTRAEYKEITGEKYD